MTRWTRSGWGIAAVALSALVAINLVLRGVGELTHSPGGRPSSAYATAPEGLAAYAELLERDGRRAMRRREPPSELAIAPESTAVVLDPLRVTDADARALGRFVRRGGRLIAGGASGPTAWIGPLLGGRAPRRAPAGPRRATPIVPLPELRGIAAVDAAGSASWRSSGSALPALGGGSGVLLSVAAVGRGRVALLADASPLQNRLLPQADDAGLGLALAGPRRRPVVFVESVHGLGAETGLAAVPLRWWWALGGLTVAALVFLLARGRRLGPPELLARPLPPARRVYVESLAAVLARTKRPADALAPAARELRRLLVARTGVDPELEPARAAAALGVDERELRTALAPAHEGDVLVAGRVLARALGEGGRR